MVAHLVLDAPPPTEPCVLARPCPKCGGTTARRQRKGFLADGSRKFRTLCTTCFPASAPRASASRRPPPPDDREVKWVRAFEAAVGRSFC